MSDSQVLLNQRELQLTIGFNYSSNEPLRSFRENRDRSLSMTIGLSYGLTKSLEVNASIPLLWNKNEVIATDNVSDQSASGLGASRYTQLLAPI